MEMTSCRGEQQIQQERAAEEIRALQMRLDSQPNYEYIKNVIIQYACTNDVLLHANFLKVLIVTLKLTQEEEQKVRDTFNANNVSYFGYLSGSKLL